MNLQRFLPAEQAVSQGSSFAALSNQELQSRSGFQNLRESRNDDDEEMSGSLTSRDSYVETEPNIVQMPSEPLSQSVHGFVMASLIQDSANLKAHGNIKLGRIVMAVGLAVLMFGLQVFLLIQTKRLVSPGEVANAREAYCLFEKVMYTDTAGTSHTYENTKGHYRGADGFFNASNFANLSSEERKTVCSLPLSQPMFLFSILWIWALHVGHNFKKSVNLTWRLSMIPRIHADDLDKSALTPVKHGMEVTGLPRWLKLSLIGFLLVPRMCIDFVLVFLGMRWLTATLGFGEVLLNTLGLTFILELGHLFYHAMVPYHGKLLTERTFVPHIRKYEAEDCRTMFGMLIVGVLSFVVALSYIRVNQQVLPDYKWDLHAVCGAYIDAEMAV